MPIPSSVAPVDEALKRRPRCLACGMLLDTPPEAESLRRRGSYALAVAWRICPCGAFARSQEVRRLEPLPDVRIVRRRSLSA